MIRLKDTPIAPLDPKLKTEKLGRARTALAGLGLRQEVKVGEGPRVLTASDRDAVSDLEGRADAVEGRLKALEARVDSLLTQVGNHELSGNGHHDRIGSLEARLGALEAARPAGATEAPPVPASPPRRKKAAEAAGGPKPWEALGIPESTYYRRKKAGKL
jgi:hypothetical protein